MDDTFDIRKIINEDDFPKLTEKEQEMPQLAIIQRGFTFIYVHGMLWAVYPN